MRKKSIEDPRPSRHDDLVAELLRDISGVVERSGFCFHIDGDCGLETEVEKPCGKGFIDLCVVGWVWPKGCAPADLRDPWKTGGSPLDLMQRALIIEVKSELEHWSAGDVIRQLKGYRKTLDSEFALEAYQKDGRNAGTSQGERTAKKNSQEPRSAVAVFSGRRLTEGEKSLFEYEGVVILS